MQWLSQMIKEQVHCDRVVTILDVCHSGAATGDKGLSRNDSIEFSDLQMGDGQVMICSSGLNQVSRESKVYQNSVFTKCLIDALQKPGIDLNSAFAVLKDKVESEVLSERGKLQTPIFLGRQWKGPPPILSIKPLTQSP